MQRLFCRPVVTQQLVASIKRTSAVECDLHPLSSGCRHRVAKNFRPIPDIHPSNLTVLNLVFIPRIAAPAKTKSR